MNRLLGASSLRELSPDFSDFAEFASLTDSNVLFGPGPGDSIHILIRDYGYVVGAAKLNGRELFYLGWINSVFGADFNPLDDPDVTASFLLKRFSIEDTDFLNDVEGSYLVVLLDHEQNRIVLASDTTGGHRLYYAEIDGALFYASHLRDFSFLLGDNLSVDRTTEEFHLAYEFLPDHRTLYSGIFSLGAGEILDWGAGRKRCSSIAHLQNLPAVTGGAPFVGVMDQLERIMLDVLKQQVPSEGKVAVLLGGFDSALIAAMLKRMGREVETFTFQYDDESYNQPYVDELAEWLAIPHCWVPITPETILKGFQNYSIYFNQPVSQAHYLIKSLSACVAIKDKGFNYCLTGDGCDGIFLGYPTVYKRAKLIQKLARASWLLIPLQYLTRVGFLERRLGHPYRLIRNVLRLLRRSMPARGYISACSVDEFSYSQLVSSGRVNQVIDSEKVLADLAEEGRGHSAVKMAYMGKSHVGLNRTKLEGCSLGAGVVLNSPYLHPHFIHFVRSMPEEFSRPKAGQVKNLGKYVLMQMAESKKYLPTDVIYQNKMSPITTPVDYWYSEVMQSQLKELLVGLPFTTSPRYVNALFRWKFSEIQFRKHVGISRYTSNILSMLLTYASFTRNVCKRNDKHKD